MERRKFIKLTSAAGVFTLLPHEVFAFLKQSGMADCPNVSGRKIVLIQLAGANDGINTLIPVNQYDTYATLRPTLKLNLSGANGIIPLDSTLAIENQVGLHPSMTGFKNLYDQGLMRIIQGVGYPSMNKSHFKSTDLWLSGGDGTMPNFNSQNGWMGRFLETYYSQYLHADFPLGIQLGSPDPSLGFHGEAEHGLSINISNQDLSGFYSVISGLGGTPPESIPDSDYGDLLRFLIDLDASTNIYAEAVSAAFNNGNITVNYPQTDLANQLKTVSRFISGGLETKIYLVKLSGFDNHEWQINAAETPHLGQHATLLKTLSDAVEAFITDLNNQGKGGDVMTMTFSEFGRKAAENANFGTDHGEVAPMFLFGQAVNPGISGTNINLGEATEGNNYQIETVQHDYRGVFSTILQDWLAAKNEVVNATFYDHNNNWGFFDKKISGIINPTAFVPASCYTAPEPVPPTATTVSEIVVFPNPCTEYVAANCPPDDAIYTITIHDSDGKKVLFGSNPEIGASMIIDTRLLATGMYHLRIQTKKGLFAKKIIVSR